MIKDKNEMRLIEGSTDLSQLDKERECLTSPPAAAHFDFPIYMNFLDKFNDLDPDLCV